MVAGLHHHLRRAENGLRRQSRSHIARQPHLHASLDQRLDDDVDIGRAGAGKPGDRVHVFFIDGHGAAHGFEEPFGQLHLRVGNEATAAKRRRAGTQRRGGIGHGAHYGNFDSRRVFNVACLDRRREGNQQLVGRQRRLDLGNQRRYLEGFDADQDQVGLLGRRQIVGANVHAPLRAERQRPLGVGHGGVNVVEGEEILLQKCL